MKPLDWVEVGAEVLAYTRSVHSGIPLSPSEGVVTKINKKTFRVDTENGVLFDLGDGEYHPTGWSASTRCVVPRDSLAARQVLHDERVARMTHHADHAVGAWQRDRTSESLRKARRYLDMLTALLPCRPEV